MESEPHGRFTYYLIEGLKGKAADQDGNIPITGLYQYVADKMKNHNEIQRPVLHCKMVEPIIVSKTKEAKRTDIAPKHKNKLCIRDSAQWCLINKNPFQYSSIKDDGASINVEIINPPSVETVVLRKLAEVTPWASGKEIHFVFGEFCYIGTASIKTELTNGNTVYKILINKKQNQRQISSEVSVGLGIGATITPLQLAELRARRILLAEERAPQFSYSEWQSLKSYIMGFAQDYRPLLEKLPIPEYISQYKDKGEEGWQIIRLFMLYYLFFTQTIDYIAELQLVIIDNKLDFVEFVGVRKSMYSNMQDDVITIKDKFIG